MDIQDQAMLKCIEHEELKALDAFGKWYKIVEDTRNVCCVDEEFVAAEEELREARTTLIFWMKERQKFKPYAMAA
jgi:hypothetical protein